MSCPLDTYPEIHRVTAVVSLASVVGGSPLAHDTSADQLKLLRNFPGAKCEPLDGGAVHDILPEPRKAWLAKHLSALDSRNDSQVILYDQFPPGSTLLT